MDTIIIEKLEVDTKIGVYVWEQSVRQTLLLDLELDCDARKVAEEDQLADALDYASVADRICVFASAHQFLLLETMAERLAQLLLQEFPVNCVRLHLRKPGAVARAASVGVRIERLK